MPEILNKIKRRNIGILTTTEREREEKKKSQSDGRDRRVYIHILLSRKGEKSGFRCRYHSKKGT
jgi:hypothetical protein